VSSTEVERSTPLEYPAVEGLVSRGAAMSEEPERWPPAADEAEVQRRMQAVFTERMEALPPAEWEAVAAATNPTRVAEPFGDEWIALAVSLDDGTRVELGLLHRSALHIEPPPSS
jgi:hypothetical protein